MFAKRLFTIALVSGCCILTGPVAFAAVVAEPDFAAFSALPGTSTTEDFESYPTPNTPAATINVTGASIAEAGGLDLVVSDMTFDTLSGTYYLGGENQFSNLISQDEVVRIDFTSPVSAVGIWVQFEPGNIANDGVIALRDTTSGTEARHDDSLSTVVLDPAFPLFSDVATFVGIRDDSNSNTISSVEIREVIGGDFGYTLDDLVFVQVTAVPEPTSVLALGAMGIGVLLRRRRR